MAIPQISEAIIRNNSNASSYSRGEEYYDHGAVSDLKRRGSLIQAEVEGSKFNQYQVSIDFDISEIISAYCSCPYDNGGWCKHIVATLLTCSLSNEIIEERPTLENLLNRLDHLQTQSLVQELVEKNPELIDEIDWFVSSIDSPTITKSPSSSRRTKIDVASIRSQVRQILEDGIEQLEYGSEDDPFTEELLAIIEEAQEFTQNSDGNSALAILEAITTTYAEVWDELTNYGGDSYSIAKPLDCAWTEAILCADIPEGEATDLQIMLESWQDEIDIDFAMSLEALRQRWNYEPLQEVMKGDSTQLYRDTRPDCASDLTLVRLAYSLPARRLLIIVEGT